MHDRYGFLVNYDPALDPEELGDEVIGDFIFNYVEPLCDCNNYQSTQALVLNTGTVIPLAGKEDRCELQEYLMAMPQEERWNAARKQCLTASCMVAGVERIQPVSIGPDAALETFEQKAQAMTVDDLVQYLRTQVSNAVAGTLEATAQAICEGGDAQSLIWRAQRSLESQEAMQSAHLMPFSNALYSPEAKWRFYDLRANLKADFGMLFVDIHT